MRPLFFPVFSPPFALYIFPVVLFWEESATIAFFFYSPLPSPSIFFPLFYFGRRVRPLLFSLLCPPSPSIFFPSFYLGKGVRPLLFSLLSLPSPSILFPSFYFGKRVRPLLFFYSALPFPLYFSRRFILGKECDHYFFLFSPLHSASIRFTSFVFCGVNFRHFLPTLLTNNNKEPVKKPKNFFHGLSFYLLQNYLLIYK